MSETNESLSARYEDYSRLDLLKLIEAQKTKIVNCEQQLDERVKSAARSNKELFDAQSEISHYWYVMGKLGRALDVDVPEHAKRLPNNASWLIYSDAIAKKADSVLTASVEK